MTLALCLARTRTERELCAAWAEREGLQAQWSAAAALAAVTPETELLPVRVRWNVERSRRDHLVESLGPQLLERRHRQLRARGDGDVLTGEAASVGELAARWSERSGAGEDSPEFAAFVERQAAITLDRAERRLSGDRYRAPRGVVEEVLTSPGFAASVEQLAHKLGRGHEVVLTDVRAYLDEMASEQQRLAVDIWARWAKWLYSRGFRLDVDEVGLKRVQELGRTRPLVFLPSHRSNLDPYVMASLLYENSLPQNHTLGGINMAFWPIGPFGRRVGVVFIRRSFRDNEVYRFVLQRYLAFLVSKRFNLEWYVEGTRTRTGKLMPPKLGLVSWLLDAVNAQDSGEVLAVPTSIVYDVLPEASEMTAESRGRVKTGEGLLWLARYARRQRGDLGAVHVRFGEPIALRETLQSQELSDARLARSKVAFEVCVRINRATVVTAPALLLFALLGVGGRALAFAEVRTVVTPVLAYARQRDIPLDAAAAALETEDGLAATLAFVTSHGLVTRFDGNDAVFRITPAQELLAAFYRNSIVHWFVNRAIVELVLAGDATERAVQWQEALRLRDLLKFEFFFPEKREFSAELERELTFEATGMLVAHRTLRVFFEAYHVVAQQLAILGDRPCDRDETVQSCLRLGEQWLLQQRLRSPESLSSHLFATGLKLADNRGLLAGGRAREREAFAAELTDVLARIDKVEEQARERHS